MAVPAGKHAASRMIRACNSAASFPLGGAGWTCDASDLHELEDRTFDPVYGSCEIREGLSWRTI